jgi:GNAT superfamily N-acetyltransferase
MNLQIRRVAPSEVGVLCRLAERTFRDAWERLNQPQHFEAYCREHFSPERMAAELARPDEEFYFALREGEPVAYLKVNIRRLPGASARPEQPLWPGLPLQIERIYVVQGLQGQGVGQALLGFAERRARQLGLPWTWLSVWQEAPRAVQFYEKNGYSVFGTETFWVGEDPQPDWLMRKWIAEYDIAALLPKRADEG